MRSGNPTLSEKTFAGAQVAGERMTVMGTVHRTGMLLAMLLIPAFWVWNKFYTEGPGSRS
jgi:uncharacterized YccA/Bax inhibitor family protein